MVVFCFKFSIHAKINLVKKILKNLKEMEKFAQFVAGEIRRSLVATDVGGATVLALYGDLGSGKTTFTKFFVSAFGVKQIVTSPTFVIEKIYKLPLLRPLLRQSYGGQEGFEGQAQKNKKAGHPVSNKFKHIIHIDAYRLNSGEEMKDLGWDKISSDPKNIILIEWPEKIADILPKDMKKIEFKFIDEDKREVVF